MKATERFIGAQAGPTPKPDPDCRAVPEALPEWRQILQGLPAYTPGEHLKGDAAAQLHDAVVRSYGADGTIRDICKETGRSYGVIHKILAKAGVLRPQGVGGNAKWIKPPGFPAQRLNGERLPHFVERVIRERIADGTYPPKGGIPSGRLLAKEFGVSEFTTIKAVRSLKEQGVLVGTPLNGLGTFVAPSSPTP